MTIDVNMQLSHMLADDIGANGDETAIIDVIHLATDAVTRENLADKISSAFHIALNPERIKQIVRRMIDDGKIVANGDVLSLSPTTKEEINRVARENEVVEKEALSQWINSFACQAGETYTCDELREVESIIIGFIRRFFLAHGADCYNFINGSKQQDISKIDIIAKESIQKKSAIDSMKMVTFLSSIFTRELTTTQEAFLLLQLRKAIHYLSMVVEKNTLDALFGVFNGITVYLDTTILYRLLNLQGLHRYESINSLIQFCQKTNMNLKVLQCTIDEMKRRICYDARVIEKHPTPVAFAAIGYKCRTEENYISTFWKERSETGISAKDFNFRYNDILAFLDSYGISVDSHDYINENHLQQQLVDMSKKVKDYGVFYDGEKTENAIGHDAECLVIVESLQKKNAVSAIEARTMFLSTDWSLIRLQRNDHEYKEKTDLVVLPSQLMQIFCLSTPVCDYFEAFLGLFASSHTVFGTGRLNNMQIQEIMGRVAAYSETPAFAERVLCNQLIQSKFAEQETEEKKTEIIDEAILAEVEQMEETLKQQGKMIAQKETELEEKGVMLQERDKEALRLQHANAEGSKSISQLSERLDKVQSLHKIIEDENKDLYKYRDIVEQQVLRKASTLMKLRMGSGLLLLILGGICILLSLGALIPFTSSIIAPVLTWMKSSKSITGESNGVIIGILIAIGIGFIPGGIALVKPGPKKLTEDYQSALSQKVNPVDIAKKKVA